MNGQRLIEAALHAGAAKAAIIPQSSIVLSETFYDICATNQCGNFGKCWMCPPDVGEIHALMDRVRSFPRGLLYQTIYPLEDSFDIEGMGEASVSHAGVSQKVQDALRPLVDGEVFHLSAGGCHLCERCARRDDAPCRFPDRALPPMEGCGIDVYKTTKDTDLKYINGANTVTYFGLFLFKEADEA